MIILPIVLLPATSTLPPASINSVKTSGSIRPPNSYNKNYTFYEKHKLKLSVPFVPGANRII